MSKTNLFGFVALACFADICCAQLASHSSPTEKKLILGFRMVDWQAKHIDDPAQAATHAETLRKLGCEVKTAQHNGHSDVQCRALFWKSMALDSSAQLQQWKAWLELAGFDVLHGHAATASQPAGAGGAHPEVVKYRLLNWRSQHVHQTAEVGQLTTLYRALACELETAEHSGHTDLKIRCPTWMQIELPTHDAAHKWQAFLNTAGFETQHVH